MTHYTSNKKEKKEKKRKNEIAGNALRDNNSSCQRGGKQWGKHWSAHINLFAI